MKKFIPYIFITAFVGTFLSLSFASSFSGIPLGPKAAEAQQAQDDQVGPTVAAEEEQQAQNSTTNKTSTLAKIGYGAKDLLGPVIGYGTWWGKGSISDSPVGHIVATILELFFYVTAKLLAMSAVLLDTVIQFTVTNFKTNIEGMGVINAGYKIILNLANMIFIFILLYISIKTILGVSGTDTKKLLTNVIIVALFINFSLFMTKVIIDASNIVSIGFLNAIKTPSAVVNGKDVVEQGSIATSWMSGLKLQTIAYNPNSEVVKIKEDRGLNYYDISMNYIGGSALNLVTAFVFFAASFLFITRFIALLFYMIFSPVAFLGILSPELTEHSSKWWKGLQNQAIFAPAFLMIAYLVSTIINSGKLMINNQSNTFHNAIQSSFTIGFPIIMNYVILIALMIGGLIAAKAMAAQGSAGMVAYADKVRGWAQGVAGRNMIGRTAYLAGNSGVMANIIDRSPIIGSIIKKQLDSVANRKFGKESGKGYSDTLKESKKQKQKIADFVASKKIGKTDELIWNEQDLNDGREEAVKVIEQRLKAPREEEKKLEKSVSKTEKEIEEINKSILESKKKYEDLNNALLGQTPTTAEQTAIDAAKIEMERDEARLENANADKTRDEAILQNIRVSMSADNTALEKLVEKMRQSKDKIDSLTLIRKNARSAMKRRYVGSLPWRSWGGEFRFLDKIFPSFVEAAEDIRKGQSKNEKDVLKMIDDLAAEKAKASGGGGASGGTTPP